MQYMQEVFDRKTGELVSTDLGGWITIVIAHPLEFVVCLTGLALRDSSLRWIARFLIRWTGNN